LSHRWGNYMPFRLLESNIKSCMSEIPLKQLSQVFLDAASVCLRLNLEFIWIDSLCKLNRNLSNFSCYSSTDIWCCQRHCSRLS
jgi:hypothetical protein